MTPAKLFLNRDLRNSVKQVQKTMFTILDDLRAQDMDSYEQLRLILKDDELAKKFMIFHENATKNLRKKILDSNGDCQREIEAILEDYDVQFCQDTELKGYIK